MDPHPDGPPPGEPEAPDPLDRLDEAMRAAAKSAPLGDYGALNRSLIGSLAAASPPVAKRPEDREPDLPGPLDELADDLLVLLREVQALAAGQAALASRVDQLGRLLEGVSASTRQDLAALREDLLSERRARALHLVFDRVIEPFERIRDMADALARCPGEPEDPAVDSREAVRNQMRAAALILGRTLQELGLEEFDVAAGEAFDPRRMTCCGYAEGAPGVVLEFVKPGYRAGDVVMWPARVRVADPMAATPPPPKQE